MYEKTWYIRNTGRTAQAKGLVDLWVETACLQSGRQNRMS